MTSEPTAPPAEDPTPPSRSSLGSQAARGAILTVGAQLIKIIVQVVGVVVLARLLSPGDYGLIAMVTAVVGVAEIFRDFGLSAAAVQAKTLSRGQRSNLFWINTVAGAILTLTVFLAAPLIAMIYDRPELVDVARALSLVFLLNGMTSQFRADLNRRLQFRRLALTDVVAPVLALTVAIVFALEGVGYWALVFQQLSTSVVLLIMLTLSARWIPSLPDRRAPMRSLLSFGWHLAGSQLLGYLGNNVDSLTIGTRFGANSLGLYNRGFQLLMTPLGQLRAPTTTVALPVLSRLLPDVDGSNRYVQRGQMALGLTLVASLGLVIGASEPITAIFLGSQWLSVEPILRLLAVAGIFQTLAYVGYWVYVSHGLTKELLRYTVLSTAIKVSCILIGSQWGVIGVAWGYAMAPSLSWPLSFWWLSRSSTISVKPLFLGAARVVILTAVVASFTWLASSQAHHLGAWWQLVIALGAGAGTYALMIALIRPYRRDIAGVMAIVRSGAGRR